MYNFNELQQVNLEITSRCQASCPMCARNIHGGIDNPSLKINDWTLADFVSIFENVITQINVFTFCGSFGDPIINKDLVSMLDYIKQHNKNAHVNLYTNGSLRSNEWWRDLVAVLPTNHNVVFGIDGLEDTHSLYRIGTDFDKIIDNAYDFIQAGGTAEWAFIRFKHNEHQVEDARQLSKELGFKKFTAKNTRRFTKNEFPVVDRQGTVTHILEQPTDTVIKIVDKQLLDKTYPKWATSKDIQCSAQNDKDLYIDANFTAMPCCFLASFMYTSYDKSILKQYNLYDDTSVNDIGLTIKNQVWELVNELGGINKLDARQGLEKIIDNSQWQSIWQDKWNNNGSLTCGLMCSSASPFISLEEQNV